MAYTRDQLARERVRPLHGRNAALDRTNFIVGPVGLREPFDDIDNTATGSTVPAYGMTRITSAANGGATQFGLAYTLAAPKAGAHKWIYHHGASTSCHVFGGGGGAVFVGGSLTSAGATMISFFRQNACAHLFGLSTAAWLVLNSKSSANASSDMWGFSFSATISS